jgi:hypothetical protein
VKIFWWHPLSGSRTRRVWDQHLPSLLDQLAEAVVPGESYVEDEITRAAFASRPAARLDAVDRLLAIEAGAAMWCVRVKVKARDEPAHNIRALVGAAPTMNSDDQRELRNDLGTWRTWAATVTGWEHPPHTPRAPCPLCSAKGTLRIRLAKETACCMACGSAWDTTNIGLLTAHIITYRTKAEGDAQEARLAAATRQRQHQATAMVGYEPRPDLPYAWTDTPTG